MHPNDKKQNIESLLKWKSDGIRGKTSLDWYSSDSEENFETRIKSKFKSTYDLYKNNPIKYEFNNYGFRTPDDFNNEDIGDVYLGCSHTAGVGNHFDDTWVGILNQDSDVKCFNLGIPAASVGTCYRILLYYKNVLKINNIFHYSLTTPRYEFVYDVTSNTRRLDYFGAYLEELEQSNTEFPYDNFILSSFLTEEYKILEQLKTFMAIQNICRELGINYYLITDVMLEKWIKKTAKTISDTEKRENLSFIESRDGAHYHTRKHYVLAQYFKFLKLTNTETKIDFSIYGF